jgi:hypothetical protein
MATPARKSTGLTPRGRVLLGLALTSQLSGWLVGDPHVQLAAAMLTAPLLVDLLLKPRSLARVALVATVRRAIAGSPFRETLVLTSNAPRALREVAVAQPNRGHGGFIDVLRPEVPVRIEIPALFRERGVLATREIELSTSWPFGLVRARALLLVAQPLVVEPARTAIEPGALAAATHPGAETDGMRPFHGDEFAGLRELQLGEDARGVHALRSAAMGQLVRTIRRGQRPQQLALVVDLRLPPGGTPRTHSRRWEHGLSLAASVLDRLRQQGAAIHVTVLGEREQSLDVESTTTLWQALDVLASAQPTTHRSLESATVLALRAYSPCWWTTSDPTGVRRELASLALSARILGKDA